MRFNPRARMGRDSASAPTSCTASGFNPRARMGRDNRRIGGWHHGALVSIHAPAWGATSHHNKRVDWDAVFQSTRPHGARPLLIVGWTRMMSVSIHAPAWGATRTLPRKAWASGCFNPRARMGRDPSRNSPSRSPRPRFNPRARMGRDFCRRGTPCPARLVSIHAPAWGATTLEEAIERLIKEFQSTRPHGARLGEGWSAKHFITVSIHAPAWGATWAQARFDVRSAFQSTRPHGARRS